MKKIIIITGASSGMGKEFALQLAKSSKATEMWLVARREGRLNELAVELKTKVNPNMNYKIIPEDIGGHKGFYLFEKLFSEEKKLCHEFMIDTLVNNAGFGTYGPFAETPTKKELEMLDINVLSLTGLCGAALPYLKKGSRILNVASLAAYSPLGNFAVYAASKAYVHSFSMALAAELKDMGVSVLSMCPGSVSTEFANVASNGARKEVLKGVSAEKTVAHALKCLDKGKLVALMTFKWKMKAFLSRFVGRYFFARYTYLNEKRPYAPE